MGWEVAVVAFFNSKKVPVSTLHRFSTAALATYAGSIEHSAVNVRHEVTARVTSPLGHNPTTVFLPR
jgi:hypothetical protein